MNYILTLDIGGTNPRMAILKIISKNNFEILEKKKINSNEESIITPINEFLYSLSLRNITTDICCISVAGVVENNSCLKPTNSKFSIIDKEILNKTELKKILVINDFEAIGEAVAQINISEAKRNKQIVEIKSGIINKKSNRAVIGAGTGLGISYLINISNLNNNNNNNNKKGNFDNKENSNSFFVSASEGGHSSMEELFETEGLFEFLSKKYGSLQIGMESIVSGQGIKNIFEFLCLKNKSFEDKIILKDLNNKNIDSGILIANSNSINSKKTMELFIKYLGVASSNIALNGLTFGGLFIAGGISSKNLNLFNNENFQRYFINNWKKTEILKKIPVYIILDYNISFYGCAKRFFD